LASIALARFLKRDIGVRFLRPLYFRLARGM